MAAALAGKAQKWFQSTVTTFNPEPPTPETAHSSHTSNSHESHKDGINAKELEKESMRIEVIFVYISYAFI
jgi:hypothetical protein